MLLEKERRLVAEYGRRMAADGLAPGTSGNISVLNRANGLFAIKPSGMEYGEIRPEDVVVMDLSGHVVDGTRKPSSEWALHTVFYQTRPEAGAVVHSHALYCTTFAVLRRPIHAVHIIFAEAGAREIPVAPYRTFGTTELAEAAAEACGDSRAVLLANHGIVCWGKDIKEAYDLQCNLEYAAHLEWNALAAGTPHFLTPEELDGTQTRFETYGQGEGAEGGAR